MKKSGLTEMIIYGVCAAIWSLTAVLSIVNKGYNDSMISFILDILCAVIWIAAFVNSLIKYRSNKDEK